MPEERKDEKIEEIQRLEIPDDKELKDFSTQERRAYLLELAFDEGYPSKINQKEMGKKFGVSGVQIHYDIDDYVRPAYLEAIDDKTKGLVKNALTQTVEDALDEAEGVDDIERVNRMAKRTAEVMGVDSANKEELEVDGSDDGDGIVINNIVPDFDDSDEDDSEE